jgi:hypothetical protein
MPGTSSSVAGKKHSFRCGSSKHSSAGVTPAALAKQSKHLVIPQQDQTVRPVGVVLVGEYSHHGAFHPGFSHQPFDRMFGGSEKAIMPGFG